MTSLPLSSLPCQWLGCTAHAYDWGDRIMCVAHYTAFGHLPVGDLPKAPKEPRQHPEADLEEQVIALLRLKGYKVAHFRPARTKDGWRTAVSADGAGWPDLVALKPGAIPALVVLELKSDKGRVAPEQQAWLNLWTDLFPPELRYMRVVRVLRPKDFDEFVRILE